jgi:hemerythrin-like domain-containing protein
MKRDPALVSLSHDHHQALFVAQRLSRATAETAGDASAAFLTYWKEHGREHFRLEEEVLFPAYAGHADPHHPLMAWVLCDHAEIRNRANAIAAEATTPTEVLNALGTRLAEHVRLEERELFPLIEEALPRERLTEVAAALDQAHGAS